MLCLGLHMKYSHTQMAPVHINCGIFRFCHLVVCGPFIIMTFRFRLRHFNKTIPNASVSFSPCPIHCSFFASCSLFLIFIVLARSVATQIDFDMHRFMQTHFEFIGIASSGLFFPFFACVSKRIISAKNKKQRNDLGLC